MGDEAIPDEGVDFGGLDVVHLLDGVLDLRFVGALVDDEDECVVVLDLLHGGLGRQRVLHDLEVVQPERAEHTVSSGTNAAHFPQLRTKQWSTRVNQNRCSSLMLIRVGSEFITFTLR